MQLSKDRILTTHVGSLPRPADLLALLEAHELASAAAPAGGDDALDDAALHARAASAVEAIVQTQVENGVDIVCDGEVSKVSYTFYVRHRLAGVTAGSAEDSEGTEHAVHRDLIDHPEFYERLKRARGAATWHTSQALLPVCTGPIDYADLAPIQRDLQNLRRAVELSSPTEAFMNAASPGVLTKFVPDRYYRDEDAYVDALANAMKQEYEAIHQAGFLLQIDAPDLGSARHNQYAQLTDAEFLRIADRNVAALNAATENIPGDAMRLHICWGNYEGPHTHDLPLAKVFDTCMRARPDALLFEAANPRHAHEWEDLKNLKIPDEAVLIPGVIDTTTNFVEHPQLVAQRLCQFASLVGRERVIAGTDCGFATFAGPNNAVVPSVVWAKLRSLREGAQEATRRLW